MWARLYSLQEKYEIIFREAKSRHDCGDGPYPSELEEEIRALRAQVDAAFREASRALHEDDTDHPEKHSPTSPKQD